MAAWAAREGVGATLNVALGVGVGERVRGRGRRWRVRYRSARAARWCVGRVRLGVELALALREALAEAVGGRRHGHAPDADVAGVGEGEVLSSPVPYQNEPQSARLLQLAAGMAGKVARAPATSGRCEDGSVPGGVGAVQRLAGRHAG